MLGQRLCDFVKYTKIGYWQMYMSLFLKLIYKYKTLKLTCIVITECCLAFDTFNLNESTYQISIADEQKRDDKMRETRSHIFLILRVPAFPQRQDARQRKVHVVKDKLPGRYPQHHHGNQQLETALDHSWPTWLQTYHYIFHKHIGIASGNMSSRFGFGLVKLLHFNINQHLSVIIDYRNLSQYN